jgi:DNA polymerase-3 subunit delta
VLHLYTGSLAPAAGSDDFRLREAFAALRAELDTDGLLGANTTQLAARNLTPAEVVQHVTTLPFLAGARLVVVEGLVTALGTRRAALEQWQPLLDVLPLLPPTNHLALLEPAREREERMTLERSPLLRALRALPGADVREFRELRTFGRERGNEVARWLTERAEGRGIALEHAAAEALAELVGADLWALSGELEKLARYAGARPITVADVRALTPAAREADLFTLIDAAVEGRGDAALRALRQRLEQGSDTPAGVTALLARQLRHLVRAAELLEAGAAEAAIGEATGVTHPFALGKLVRQAGALGRPAAEAGLRAVAAADLAAKEGTLDETLALELLLAALAAITPAARGTRRRA